MPSTSRLLQIVFLLATMLLQMGTSWATSADQFFDQTLGDYKVELAAAVKDGKQGMLIMFEAEGCPYCRRMKESVLNRDDVQAYYHGRFAIVAVDILGAVPVTDFAGHEMTEKQFARSLRVSGTPTFVFIGPDGVERTRYVGATRDAKTFLQLGRYVADGHFRQTGFDAFLKTDHGN